MLDINKNGICKKSKFFSNNVIDKFERQLIFYIYNYTKKKSKKISLKAKKILNLKSKNFRIKSIKLLEEIEQKNKKLFYNISITCGKTFGLNTFDITKKNNNFLKRYFKEQFSNIEPFIDMVQDISIPSSCSEIDKERAGIPSTLTNIT